MAKLKNNNKTGLITILAGLLTTALVFLQYFIKGYAPFGDMSLGCMDANVGYLEFFAHIKNAFEGKASFLYSFSKGLGGNMLGVFTTGYFSPLNLIIVFFDKSNLHSFFDVVVALKLGLSALTMALFLKKRFIGMQDGFVMALSVCYGLCQYNLAQSSNIFFLEGSYMLPLFMLGTYYVINNRKPYLLVFSVAYTVAISWYMGGINCFYTIIWAAFEFLWASESNGFSVKKMTMAVARMAIAAITGILISGIVFIPTIIALQKSSEGSLDLFLFLHSNVFIGNMITSITDYYWGATSNNKMVSFFSGSLPLVGCVAFFITDRFSIRKKLVVGGMLFVTSLIFYWYPLYVVFSLFKYVGSFWSRYGYIGCFVIVFVAGLFFSEYATDRQLTKKIPVAILFIASIMLLYHGDQDLIKLKWVYATIFSICIVGILILVHQNYLRIDEKKPKRFLYLIVMFTIAEMWCNSWLLMNMYHQNKVHEHAEYIEQGAKQIASIKEADDGYYRISQTKTRAQSEDGLTANYSEAHSLNYWGVASYTSVPDDLTREFLDRSGYRINGEDMIIVNYPILPVDSIIGVKYVLSDKDIPGMNKSDKFKKANDKDVYINPYAIPMAFTTDVTEYSGFLNYPDVESNAGKASSINPFLYQNDIFSQLTGEKTELYIPIEYKKKEIAKDEVEFTMTAPEGNYVLYGNLPWKKERNEVISLNDKKLTSYAKWKSPSVFPINSDSDEIKITVTGEEKVSIKEEQFYALDLDVLEKSVAKARNSKLSEYTIEDGHFKASVSSEGNERLITSIPYEPQWEVTLNGETIEPELFADTFISLPLTVGENSVEFKYHIGGIGMGGAFTLVGLLLLVCYIIIYNKKRGSEENE